MRGVSMRSDQSAANTANSNDGPLQRKAPFQNLTIGRLFRVLALDATVCALESQDVNVPNTEMIHNIMERPYLITCKSEGRSLRIFQ
jgi:hypothetical protein